MCMYVTHSHDKYSQTTFFVIGFCVPELRLLPLTRAPGSATPMCSRDNGRVQRLVWPRFGDQARQANTKRPQTRPLEPDSKPAEKVFSSLTDHFQRSLKLFTLHSRLGARWWVEWRPLASPCVRRVGVGYPSRMRAMLTVTTSASLSWAAPQGLPWLHMLAFGELD